MADTLSTNPRLGAVSREQIRSTMKGPMDSVGLATSFQADWPVYGTMTQVVAYPCTSPRGKERSSLSTVKR